MRYDVRRAFDFKLASNRSRCFLKNKTKHLFMQLLLTSLTKKTRIHTPILARTAVRKQQNYVFKYRNVTRRNQLKALHIFQSLTHPSRDLGAHNPSRFHLPVVNDGNKSNKQLSWQRSCIGCSRNTVPVDVEEPVSYSRRQQYYAPAKELNPFA